MISKEGVLVDSTTLKADASIQSLVDINISGQDYWKQLDKSKKSEKTLAGDFFTGEVDKNKMGKRRRDVNRTSIKKKSTTDPDAILYYRPGQGSHLSYKAHIATDTNGIIT